MKGQETWWANPKSSAMNCIYCKHNNEILKHQQLLKIVKGKKLQFLELDLYAPSLAYSTSVLLHRIFLNAIESLRCSLILFFPLSLSPPSQILPACQEMIPAVVKFSQLVLQEGTKCNKL